jgi:hypothetical protein
MKRHDARLDNETLLLDVKPTANQATGNRLLQLADKQAGAVAVVTATASNG